MNLPVNRHQLGKTGEEIAAAFLVKAGYQIINRNFRIKKLGEIDIVAEEKNDLVFIEVKNRSDLSFGLPQEAVNSNKQHRLIKLALMYIKMKNIKSKNIRFDVLAITPAGCELIKNAFISNRSYTY